MTYRLFNSSTWSDSWFEDLSVEQRYLFIFLWTNPDCKKSGIYEKSIRKISFETKLDQNKVLDLLLSLSPAINYDQEKNIIWIKNFIKYQHQNKSFFIGALKEVEKDYPQYLLDFIKHNLLIVKKYSELSEYEQLLNNNDTVPPPSTNRVNTVQSGLVCSGNSFKSFNEQVECQGNPVDQKTFYSTKRGKGIQNCQPIEKLDFSGYRYPELAKELSTLVDCSDAAKFNSFVDRFDKFELGVWKETLHRIKGFRSPPCLATVEDNFNKIEKENPDLNKPPEEKQNKLKSSYVNEIKERITYLEYNDVAHQYLIDKREKFNTNKAYIHRSLDLQNRVETLVGPEIWDTYINLLERRKVNFRPGEKPKHAPEKQETAWNVG